MAGNRRLMPPAVDLQDRLRSDRLTHIAEELNKLGHTMADRPLTPAEQQRREDLEAERARLAEEPTRGDGLATGEAFDRFEELERESRTRPLTPDEVKEFEKLKNVLREPYYDPDDDLLVPPQIGEDDDNSNDLAGSGDGIGDLRGPDGPQPQITPKDLELGRENRDMEENPPRGTGGGSTAGSGGTGTDPDAGGQPDGTDGEPGGGMGGGAEMRGLSESPDAPSAGRRPRGLRGLGSGPLSLNAAVKRKLGNLIKPTRDGQFDAGDLPTGPTGRVVGDPGPDPAPHGTPTSEERRRPRRPGEDPRVTDPPDDDDRF